MERRLERIAKSIKKDAGDNPIVFLDTGAVIDFERELKLWRLKDSTRNIFQWYSVLDSHFPIYVPEGAMREITRHHEIHRINGRPEISSESFEIAEKYHEDYCNFLKTMSSNGRDFDKVRLDVYWAGQLSFEGDLKKGVLDIISTEDIETVETAAWCRYASDSERKPITSSIIVSPDSHLRETVRTIIDKNPEIVVKVGKFDYDNINVVSSRYSK